MLSTISLPKNIKLGAKPKEGAYFRYWLLDIMTFILAFMLALLMREDGSAYEHNRRFVALLPLVVISYSLATYAFSLHRHIWRDASLSDMFALAEAISFTIGCILTANFALGDGHALPLGAVIIGGVFAFTGIITARVYCVWKNKLRRSSGAASRLLIIGCDHAAQMLARELLYNHTVWNYIPVGFVDDDPKMQGVVVHGLAVCGTRAEIPLLVQSLKVDLIVIASRGASNDDVQQVLAQVGNAAVGVKLLPSLPEIIEGAARLSTLQEIAIEDLLGRPQVEVDYAACHGYLAGQVVLITGAAGSIGAELCRQVITLGPARLLILDTNESGLYDLNFELSQIAPSVPVTLCLTDITNRHKLEDVFAQYQPQVIFHAAAYKHVPMMESCADQAVLANVQGTFNLARLASGYDCGRFIFISTDKSVRPANVMGATKRIAELITMNIAKDSHTRFCAVRFGNVLGSRGSVVPLFLKQIEQGGPVTVTHPDVRRFFMSIPEAVRLVIQSGAYDEENCVYMLEMGLPIRIAQLAERMIRLKGYRPGVDIEITYTGLRPGEKLDEELTTPQEYIHPTHHQQIYQVLTPSLADHRAFFRDVERLCDMAGISNAAITRHLLWRFIAKHDASNSQPLANPLSEPGWNVLPYPVVNIVTAERIAT